MACTAAASTAARGQCATGHRGGHRRRQRPPAAAPGHGADTTAAAAAHAAAHAAAAGRDGRREVAVLGGEDFILSQKSGVSEELFKGDKLGIDADIAGGAGFEEQASGPCWAVP